MKPLSIGIVGGESLAGKEVREVLRQRNPAWQLHLIGADESETGKIIAEGDEPAVVTALDAVNLNASDAVLLAGSPASSRKAWELLRKSSAKTPLIDVTRALEDIPSARLCAPTAAVASSGWPAVIAHPAAIMLATFHRALMLRFPVRQWIVEVFEPASERGQPGIDELHQQTIKLFSFQKMPKEVYDTQLAYSMLAAYGAESPHSLEKIEQTIERHLASLLAVQPGSVMPSLRLLQAPVFHGYMASAWVEFAKETDAEALADSLRGPGFDIRGEGEEPPGNPSIAGHDGLTLGDIRADRNHPRAAWLWIASDNLRLPATNAAEVVDAVCA